MNIRERRLLYVSGSRSDFGLMRPVLSLLREAGWETTIVVTGMNLLPEYEQICTVIAEDGHRIWRLDSHLAADSGASMAKAFGLEILGLADVFATVRPAVALVQGDRGEALATAIVAAHVGVPVVHMAGGDVTGSIDDMFRHSISQFADVHLPATVEAAEVLRRICLKAGCIQVVGDPAIDGIRHTPIPDEQEVRKRLGLPPSVPYLVVAQHPVVTEADQAADQMAETMAVLCELAMPALVILPNTDAGGLGMRRVIEKHIGAPYLVQRSDVPRELYLGAIKFCAALVGNTSSGIVEAPCFGTPYVNIGSRQEGRVRGSNVVDVAPQRLAIREALLRIIADEGLRARLLASPNPYGTGNTASEVVSILGELAKG